MDRARLIAAQEPDRDQVQHHAHRTRNTILAAAELARAVVDGHLGHGAAHLAGQRGDEAVQFAVEMHMLEHVAPVRLEAATVIVQPHVRYVGDEAIGHHGRQLAIPVAILPVEPPAADDVVALVNLGHEQRNVHGVILQVGVHGDDYIAACVVKAAREGGRLPRIAAQAQDGEARVLERNLAQQFKRAIARAVVHNQHFGRLAVVGHRRHQPVIQRGYALFFVVERNDDGDARMLGIDGRRQLGIDQGRRGRNAFACYGRRTLTGDFNWFLDHGINLVENGAFARGAGQRTQMRPALLARSYLKTRRMPKPPGRRHSRVTGSTPRSDRRAMPSVPRGVPANCGCPILVPLSHAAERPAARGARSVASSRRCAGARPANRDPAAARAKAPVDRASRRVNHPAAIRARSRLAT